MHVLRGESLVVNFLCLFRPPFFHPFTEQRRRLNWLQHPCSKDSSAVMPRFDSSSSLSDMLVAIKEVADVTRLKKMCS